MYFPINAYFYLFLLFTKTKGLSNVNAVPKAITMVASIGIENGFAELQSRRIMAILWRNNVKVLRISSDTYL